MTIKTKLTLNVVIVLAIVAAVSVTSIIGMGVVKSKLFYLTERSTPYQMRTVEFQKSVQEVTANLIEFSISKNREEYSRLRAQAEKSMSDVKTRQNGLETLSGSAQMTTHKELEEIASDLFGITQDRLQAEDDAETAKKIITQKLNDSSDKLNDLDKKIRSLQLNRSAAFIASMDNTKELAAKLKTIQLLLSTIKDLQVGLAEVTGYEDKKSMIIANGKITAVTNKALQNEYLKESKNLSADIKTISGKILDIIKYKSSIAGGANNDANSEYNKLHREVGEKLSVVLLIIEQEITSLTERYQAENEKQQGSLVQVNISNNILGGNAELMSLGLSVDGLTTRLFTALSVKDIDIIEKELKSIFELMAGVAKNLEKALNKIKAADELKILQNTEQVILSIKGSMFAQDGIIAKLRHRLNMQENALHATQRLKELVVSQAAKNRATVTEAQDEQEKAISTVNKTVRFGTTIMILISIGAVVFGIAFGMWVYKSIAKPLHELISTSNDVAQGNLKNDMDVSSSDEIGIVQSSMAKMVSNLREIVGKIMATTDGLSNSSDKLSATATILDKGSIDQTTQVEQSASAMTEMSQSILSVARNASDTSKTAQKMKENAIRGKKEMDTTVKVLSTFVETIKDSAVKIELLGHKSAEVNNVVTLIKEIADQTNLLALNAAIEAARAGEQGRGFAVVADNVRQLAERTTNATNDITKTINTMETEILDSVRAMKEEKTYAENVLDSIRSTLQSIEQIVAHVEEVADMVQRIAAATEEQTTTSDAVSHNMENVAGITRHLNSSVSEIKRSSDDLTRLATELNSMAGWFQV
ncbi:MAG: methyl-accepting chemotaxis protein [Nitrospiraceae bacterium]|nr:MAG: methyl-accepting chemotaxis protein [Nitrospiraceae bacterium]